MGIAARVEQQPLARMLITLLDFETVLACRFHQSLAAAMIEPRVSGEPNRLGLHGRTIRLKLFKIGALVRISTRRVWLELSSTYP
jgi:hypothetical protein